MVSVKSSMPAAGSDVGDGVLDICRTRSRSRSRSNGGKKAEISQEVAARTTSDGLVAAGGTAAVAQNVDDATVAADVAGSSSSSGDMRNRLARLRDAAARKRDATKQEVKQQKIIEAQGVEIFSGLRIEDRCVRQEKWEASMQGKTLVPFYDFAALRRKTGDQVVIAVLCGKPRRSAVPSLERDASADSIMEWAITDLDARDPCKASLLLAGRAVNHWCYPQGDGFAHAKIGSIFAILNPEVMGRAATIRVTVESQLLKLGSSPSLAFCSAKLSSGLDCSAPYNGIAGAGYCAHHANMSMGGRCHDKAGPRARSGPAPAARRGCSRSVVAAGPIGTQDRGTSAQASAPSSEPALLLAEKASISSNGSTDAVVELPLTAAASQARELVLEAGKSRRATAMSATPAQVLGALRELESLDDRRAMKLAHAEDGALYDALGQLVRRSQDSVGVAAGQLRRRWRLLANADTIGGKGGGRGGGGASDASTTATAASAQAAAAGTSTASLRSGNLEKQPLTKMEMAKRPRVGFAC
eukprot:TRINITY_DN9712_c0_g1_i1.p1 TRINITY_DN9712_c0_g1~~TRINITY_DN9712_c0_g1_i1.p1  ORF type:complete len:528 (+),score=111.51 TRINITY_DN9712_c0_g1_i1:61-1644(+)